MTGNITMKRSSVWIVELYTPLKHGGKDITEVVINPAGFETVIRWGRDEIPSTMALLAEQTGLPERLLRTITYPDVDRLMLAFTAAMPPSIQADFNAGKKQFATDDDELPQDEEVNDQVDPRFPKVDGPVVRMTQPEKTAVTPTPAPDLPVRDGSGLSAAPPETMRAVR